MSQIMPPFQLLELNVISAQDLAPVGRNMRTYAVSWVHPDRKLSTRVDTQGHMHPTWNDKFVFRVDDNFLCSDDSAIMIEIYALHWFKDIHVGTVRVLVGNLAPPPSRPSHSNRTPLGMRFVALQVRRPSGRPQGILNIGFTVLDGSMHSMPLYTHNPSAVGYRHLMGEKDAYDSHNHLSPHVLAAGSANPKAELRRAKSDTSSVVAAEAVARQHRAVANHNRANSNISAYQVNVDNNKEGKKKKKKSRSKSSSVVSSVNEETASVLSDTVGPWKIKSGKASPHDDDILHVEQISPLHHHPIDGAYDDIHNHQYDHDANSDVNSVSDGSISENNFVTDAIEEQHVPYEVRAAPKQQFRNSPAPHYMSSPAPQFRNSPAPQHMNSPAPQFKNSPAPQYMNSPAPQFKNSPAPQYMNSPAPQFKNSPKPQYMNSPAPHYMSSPVPQFKNSPAPQFKNSPVPQYMSSPAPKFKNLPMPQYIASPKPQYIASPKPQYIASPKPQYIASPKPQYIASPKPQYISSPKPQYISSPKPQFRNSPAVGAPQFRASPAVSKFNPNRETPMHRLGKVNGGFEYMTPRMSNLGNMGPMMMTESELGPSPSEVAAAIARKPVIDEGENSTVGGWSLDESVEGLGSKLERWRSDLPPVIDRGELSSHQTSSTKTSRHSRRHTDGGSTPNGGGSRSGSRPGGRGGSGGGLFSCFSKICGVECYIGCGSDPKGKKDRRRRSASVEDNTSSLL